MPPTSAVRRGSRPSTAGQPRSSATGRERLLAAAVSLFASKGFAATSVRDILQAADVTAPTLYYHFGSKEGLFLTIVREAQVKFEQAQAEALRGGTSAAARIGRLGRAHTDIRRQYAALVWIVEQILSGPAEAAPPFDFRAAALESVSHFEKLVEEGVASGEFRPCRARHVALALMGAVEIAARPHIFDPDGREADTQLDGMIGAILAGIVASAG